MGDTGGERHVAYGASSFKFQRESLRICNTFVHRRPMDEEGKEEAEHHETSEKHWKNVLNERGRRAGLAYGAPEVKSA